MWDELWLPCSPVSMALSGSVLIWQVLMADNSSAAPHSHSNSTSAGLSSRQMDRSYKLEEPLCLSVNVCICFYTRKQVMSPTKYRDEVIIRSEVVLQIPVKASPFFKGVVLKPGFSCCSHGKNLWLLLEWSVGQLQAAAGISHFLDSKIIVWIRTF